MKKKIILSFFAFCAFTTLMLNLNLNEKFDRAEVNFVAFEQASATDPVNCFTCYSVTESCWIFGCTNVPQCSGLCPILTVDEWSVPGKCGCAS